MAHLRVRLSTWRTTQRFPWARPSQKVGATVGETAAPISAASFGDRGTGADGLNHLTREPRRGSRASLRLARKSHAGWLVGWPYVPRLKISHRLFAARCVAAIIDRGRLLPRGYRPKPRLWLRCLRVAHNAGRLLLSDTSDTGQTIFQIQPILDHHRPRLSGVRGS